MRELYEADLHKPGIYGTGRAWANVWDVFHHMPPRGGRGRRAAVAFVVCFRWGGIFSCFQVITFFFEFRARVHDRWLRETQTAVSVD